LSVLLSVNRTSTAAGSGPLRAGGSSGFGVSPAEGDRASRKVARAVALAAFLLALSPSAGDTPKPDGPPARKGPDPAAVEVRFTDNSTLKLVLRDPHVEIATRYGPLRIPVADVRRIEFGTRVPDDVAKGIEAAINNLGSPQYKLREAAQTELIALKEKAFPALVRATKHKDPEVIRRAEELLTQLREAVPDDLLEAREFDVVSTDDMHVSGRITGEAFKAATAQFGEQSVKLTDLRSLRSMLVAAHDTEAVPKSVLADPGSVTQYQGQIGASFYFRVTGANNGTVWGSDVYTTDSSLATAAVHAGAVGMGQTGVVKVTIVPSPNVFAGTTRNGITTNPYGMYPVAFTVTRVGGVARGGPGGAMGMVRPAPVAVQPGVPFGGMPKN